MTIDFPLEDLQKTLSKTKSKALKITFIRLFVFFTLIPVLILGLTDYPALLILFFAQLSWFVHLIIRSNHYKDMELFFLELMNMEKEKQLRLARNLKGFDTGFEFQTKSHPFSIDLDVFGEHSLFQLINHSCNFSGKKLLAEKLKANLNPKSANEWRPAVDELQTHADLLLHFEAAGRAFIKEEKPKEKFYSWLKDPLKWSSFFYIPLILGPSLGLALILGVATGLIPAGYIGIWIILGLTLLSFIHKPLSIASSVFPDHGDTKTYRIWSELLGKSKFQNEFLKNAALLFQNPDQNISKGLKTLEQVSFLVQNRINLVYLIFNLLFWLDFVLLWQLKKWKSTYEHQLQQLDSIFDEWQVLISLGSFASQENLKGEISWTNQEVLTFKSLNHPLLPQSKAVSNSLHMPESIQTILLTGANMSGKTTFMRTIGTNMILSNLGLRPFAESLEIGPFQLYTSMRNSDNLGESVSSFYAELARIRQVLEAAENGQKVFFLMDEILKGTNTTDRIQGSEALIKQLATAEAKGIISTHDIELSTLEQDLDYLKNFSFHSEIADREIHFDYTLKAGPCPSFNAHKLMELMGIRFT
ncbi:MutS-related protein, family 1 [Indibacter alkaliphilus LW1]|uniref:MutS-related protein, family 1 n=1 Tax=Indibacter alkaliphilus (strain CCUG 57479 / KCTC 22604 / LW1) TaxID=1189612 RepID=S2D4R5_INDAL|nr:DNA mismatch repair protein [Indibacter alkaliphilus]EOZ92040.1 MutS-related protein, family 1 [Indibacter alkaliphilus LW1]